MLPSVLGLLFEGLFELGFVVAPGELPMVELGVILRVLVALRGLVLIERLLVFGRTLVAGRLLVLGSGLGLSIVDVSL